ncbi:hypothetical protein EJF36_09965 [Bacillus sp. HMF5848]|uniref:hypothetical protein n=1 Tax=Bacillus sp. HMF5848 TaxID=2495421 RepID=UPI000F77809D|nr:hypothetical protein [Bacillus sp. HMF5848]RSK27178.1 hypothetical protein EJF36_09965 [Bacillus sp. HMF5848]
MNKYVIEHMIIDDFTGDETVTVHFNHNNSRYSIDFDKADLEVINSWVLRDQSSLPANLDNNLIEQLRVDVMKKLS